VLPAALYSRALVETHLGLIEAARADAGEALMLAGRSRNGPVSLEAMSVLGLIELSVDDSNERMRAWHRWPR
jgi:hypothetical protein